MVALVLSVVEAVAVTDVGVDGAAANVVNPSKLATEYKEVPILLVAATWHVYVVPPVKPVKASVAVVQDRPPTPVHVMLPARIT
jgi:hypothetical protein